MADLQLKTTITNIAKFERETGQSLMRAFSEDNMGVATIVDLVKACSNATDEDIDAYVAEHGFESLNDKLMESFQKSGFLAKPKPNQATSPKTQ